MDTGTQQQNFHSNGPNVATSRSEYGCPSNTHTIKVKLQNSLSFRQSWLDPLVSRSWLVQRLWPLDSSSVLKRSFLSIPCNNRETKIKIIECATVTEESNKHCVVKPQKPQLFYLKKACKVTDIRFLRMNLSAHTYHHHFKVA